MPITSTNKKTDKKTPAKRPKLSAATKTKFAERLDLVEIKFGGVNVSSIVINNEQLEGVLKQAVSWYNNDDIEGYLIIKTPEFGELHVALVETPIATTKEDNFQNWGVLANWKSDEKFWYNVKCAEAPNNQLQLRMTEEIFEDTAEEEIYIAIGVIEIQWKIPGKTKEAKATYVKEKPEGNSFEQHTLVIVEMIGG